MEEVRKLYDYKLNIPSSMLAKIGVKRSESLKIIEVENGILLQKVIPESFCKESIQEKQNNLKPKIFEQTEFCLKVVKRDLVSIPMVLFKKYELAKKRYNIEWKFSNDGKQTIAKIILDKNGKYSFRLDNIWSVGIPFKKNNLYKVVEGEEILLRDNGFGIEIVFNIPTTQKVINQYSKIVYKEKEENIVIDLNKEEYKKYYTNIHKRLTLTLPSDLIKNYNILNKNYSVVDRILEYNNESIILKFEDQGVYTFPKNPTLNLKSLVNPIKIYEGQKLELLINEDYLIINFLNNSKNEQITVDFKIDNIKDKEKKRIKKISSDLYQKQIDTFIKKGAQIKLINKEDLLEDEYICSKCGKELTDKDLSMINSHRVCNSCKSSELKTWFNPIKELAKLRRNEEC